MNKIVTTERADARREDVGLFHFQQRFIETHDINPPHHELWFAYDDILQHIGPMLQSIHRRTFPMFDNSSSGLTERDFMICLNRYGQSVVRPCFGKWIDYAPHLYRVRAAYVDVLDALRELLWVKGYTHSGIRVTHHGAARTQKKIRQLHTDLFSGTYFFAERSILFSTTTNFPFLPTPPLSSSSKVTPTSLTPSLARFIPIHDTRMASFPATAFSLTLDYITDTSPRHLTFRCLFLLYFLVAYFDLTISYLIHAMDLRTDIHRHFSDTSPPRLSVSHIDKDTDKDTDTLLYPSTSCNSSEMSDNSFSCFLTTVYEDRPSNELPGNLNLKHSGTNERKQIPRPPIWNDNAINDGD
ncbi:hypothetical protein HGRIS_001279 [Hohenbuehelia grisea]|uniref:Uncharacterized protein n=1 Tax=Hohenbuehelia grisea TaxID=104357 RepID=A0ABR3JPN4_9AGAR